MAEQWASVPGMLGRKQEALQRWNPDYEVSLSFAKVERAIGRVQPSWVHDLGICWFGCLTAEPWGEWLAEHCLGEDELCRYLQAHHVAYGADQDLLVVQSNPEASLNDDFQALVDEDETVHGENVTESLRWVLLSIRNELDQVEDLWDFIPLAYCPACAWWLAPDSQGRCPECGEVCLEGVFE